MYNVDDLIRFVSIWNDSPDHFLRQHIGKVFKVTYASTQSVSVAELPGQILFNEEIELVYASD